MRSCLHMKSTMNNNLCAPLPSLRPPMSRKLKENQIIRAQLVELEATRKVNVPFKQRGGETTGENYIKQTDRIVKITFPDSTRIKCLGDNVWQARLKPVTFFTLTASSSCDVKVFHSKNSLQLSSNRLVLDLVGLPGLNDDLDINFSLRGELTVHRDTPSPLESKEAHNFRGWVRMQLNVDLPFPFSVMPESVLLPVGNGILDRIVGAMEEELVSRILRDYNVWCYTVSSHMTDSVRQTLAT